MVQAITPIPTSSGLLNPDCSAMAVFLFMSDHKATTISRATDAVKAFNQVNAAEYYEDNPSANPADCEARTAKRREYGDIRLDIRKRSEALKADGATDADVDADPEIVAMRAQEDEALETWKGMTANCPVNFALATANVGVMAATNETVSAAQFPMLMWIFAAIIVLCLITFRSLRATLCIVIPLALVSILAYALMTILEIGLKISTLPVVALGVGIGVGGRGCRRGRSRAAPRRPWLRGHRAAAGRWESRWAAA